MIITRDNREKSDVYISKTIIYDNLNHMDYIGGNIQDLHTTLYAAL